MYIKDEILRHFEPDIIGKKICIAELGRKTNIPAWKLQYFAKSGGNLYIDEFLRLILVLGYKIYTPEGNLLYGNDQESVRKAVIENSPKP